GTVACLSDHLGPSVDGAIQIVAVALHAVGELIAEQLADVDTVDDHIAQLPLAVQLHHGIGHRVDGPLTAGDLHTHTGPPVALGPGRKDTDTLVVVLKQRVAIELHQTALEAVFETLELLRTGT